MRTNGHGLDWFCMDCDKFNGAEERNVWGRERFTRIRHVIVFIGVKIIIVQTWYRTDKGWRRNVDALGPK